jgi:carbonic anhydrase
MFIHRNIANPVVHTDPNLMTVLDYGVYVLGIDQVIVYSHYNCGGVKVAMGPEFDGPAADWIRRIRDVARWHRRELLALADEQARFDRLVEINVAEQVDDLSRTCIIRVAWEAGRPVHVHGWVYSLNIGLITDLHVTRTRYEEAASEAGAG